jgi:uroporphyrinogen III methyltransferase/synthase
VTAILVTRPAGHEDPLVDLLEHRGYRVHAVPTVETEPNKFDARDLATCDWIVLTSVNGVDALTELPRGPQYAAVGEKTAAALRARGTEPALVPPLANAAALADSLPNVEGKRIVLVRASAAGTDLPEILRRRGASVEEMNAYTTIEGPAKSAAPLRAALGDPGLAAVVFASGSAIRGYIKLGGNNQVSAVTIGPGTTATAREHGFQVIAEAEARSAEELAAAVARAIPLKETKHA